MLSPAPSESPLLPVWETPLLGTKKWHSARGWARMGAVQPYSAALSPAWNKPMELVYMPGGSLPAWVPSPSALPSSFPTSLGVGAQQWRTRLLLRSRRPPSPQLSSGAAAPGTSQPALRSGGGEGGFPYGAPAREQHRWGLQTPQSSPQRWPLLALPLCPQASSALADSASCYGNG